ncbi:MAG TPA: hypothetical protein VIH57_00325, partial [Bacteroidales bacterium]
KRRTICFSWDNPDLENHLEAFAKELIFLIVLQLFFLLQNLGLKFQDRIKKWAAHNTVYIMRVSKQFASSKLAGKVSNGE